MRIDTTPETRDANQRVKDALDNLLEVCKDVYPYLNNMDVHVNISKAEREVKLYGPYGRPGFFPDMYFRTLPHVGEIVGHIKEDTFNPRSNLYQYDIEVI